MLARLAGDATEALGRGPGRPAANSAGRAGGGQPRSGGGVMTVEGAAVVTTPRSGERFARRVVTGCAVLVVVACFGFSFGNVLALGRYLAVPEWVAWLVAPAVDLTVVGLIVGVRHLSLRGVEGRRLRPARLLLVAAGLATWALNTAHALFVRGHLGVVAYDSLAPLLLIGWAEVGPWFLRQFQLAAASASSRPQARADRGADHGWRGPRPAPDGRPASGGASGRVAADLPCRCRCRSTAGGRFADGGGGAGAVGSGPVAECRPLAGAWAADLPRQAAGGVGDRRHPRRAATCRPGRRAQQQPTARRPRAGAGRGGRPRPVGGAARRSRRRAAAGRPPWVGAVASGCWWR